MNLYLLAVIVLVNLAIWAYFDASRLRDEFHLGIGPKGLAPHAWASLVLMLMPLALPSYLAARSDARQKAKRDGPPPVFTARDLNAWGYTTSIVFFVLSVYLLLTGELMFGVLAGIGVVAGLFGGRTARQEKDASKQFELGRAAWDMTGFKPMNEEELDDDLKPAIASAAPTRSQPAASKPAPAAPEARPQPTASQPEAPAGDAAGVDVFSPLNESNRSGPAAQPIPGVFDPDLVADAAPPVAMSVSDDDVWDPVRADEEGQKARERELGVVDTEAAPAPASTPVSSSVPPPAPPAPPAASPPDDDLAPFQLGSEDDPAEVAEEEPDDDDQNLADLLPLPPMVSGGRRAAAESQRAARSTPGARQPGEDSPAATVPPRSQQSFDAAAENFGATGSVSRPAGGYAGSSAGSGPPAALLWFGGIAMALLIAWGYSKYREIPDDPAIAETGSVTQTAATKPSATPPPKVDQAARAAEEAMRLRMNEWISTYDSVMRPIAELVEEIDFGELTTGACMELKRKAQNADRSLASAPDQEIEILLRPAFDAFVAAGDACVFGRKMAWSVNLLQAKDHTHETQLLLDERYRYVGPYELEQEEALGHARSLQSISGLYLAGELEADPVD